MTIQPTQEDGRPTLFTPVDDEARLAISHDLDVTLFVEASAGTGKTTSLVQRVTNLVATGRTTLNRIAAITFTEAAAAELRDRIRASLEQASQDNTLGKEERDRCRQGVVDLDMADISTLHSFAGGLLRERPLEAGLPPAFETSDEIVAGITFNERWDNWVDRHLDGDTDLEPHLAMALTLGVSLERIKTIAQEFHRNYSDLAETRFEASSYPTPTATATLVESMSELERLCEYSKKGTADTLYNHVQSKLPAIQRTSETPVGTPDSYRLLQGILRLSESGGRQGDWDTDPTTGKNACTALKDLLTELHQEVSAEIAETRRAAFITILENLRSFVLDYAQERRNEGRAEFHDLLVWARELLRDNLAVRDHFRRKYSHLLIDEAQDTDPIQAEIAILLAEAVTEADGNAQRPTEWRQITPERGKLFVVGDPKQSIYRFRRADVQQMSLLQQRLEQSGGRTISLVQNFRSQRPVVQWVNHVFEMWMDGDGGASADELNGQARYESMFHRWEAREASDVGPRVWALGNEEMEGTIDPIRGQEAGEIATLLGQMVAEPWQTLDRDATEESGRETYRRVRYSDVCILMPTRTGLAILERALEERNLLYRVEGSSLMFETQEIRDLMNSLRAIDNPADQVAVVAALRSTAFGCSDVDLFRHRDEGGSFDYLDETRNSGAGLVPEALGVLRQFHRARVSESTQTLIDRFIRERELMEAATGHPRMREQWRRYRFLVEQAARFTNAGGGPLGAYLAWLDDLIKEDPDRARVTESPVPESDEDAVRIMTIHGAKGLEFPVVILTGINSTSSRTPDPVLFDRRRGRVEVGFGPRGNRICTPNYEELLQQDNQMSTDERVRLMYVATTRARDHLVVSLRRGSGNPKSTAAVISEYVDAHPDLWEAVQLKEFPELPSSGPDGTIHLATADGDGPHSIEAHDRWSEEHRDMLADLGRPEFVAATALYQSEEDDKPEPDNPEPWRRGRAGTYVGRAVHAVLQTIDLATGEGLDHRSRAQAVAESVASRHAEIARLVRVALGSDIVRRAVAARRRWREVPVALPIGEGSVHGFVDLLFEEDDGLVVVDYKTDTVTEAELPNAAERYRLQGGAYALAVSHATGQQVKEMVFLYLQPNREWVLEDLTTAMQDAEAAARAQLAARTS